MEAYENAYEKQGWFWKTDPPYSLMPNRRIVTNCPDLQVCKNEIKTSKYTLLDFLPLNLLVQFSKLPNIYFLVIGVMQMVPQISASGGFPAIYIPLLIVVAVSVLKDFYEDVKRKQSDEKINNQPTEVLTQDGFTVCCWKDCCIGQLIRVTKDQEFPTDMILLSSSEPRMNCFIETKNLDGETNLKMKQVKNQLGKELLHASHNQLYQRKLEFKYERPNPFIYDFTGSWNGVALDNSNIVLRGCTLRITKSVVGVAIYTGNDSKIMLNSNQPRQKKSRLEFRMGIVVIVVFAVQLLLTLCCAIIAALNHPPSYLPDNQDSFFKILMLRWGGWILLFTNFVPISLIVSLEVIKYVQGNKIAQSEFKTTAPATVVVQTSTLNEELGQIQHLFTDKTGTLTKNYMSFKYMALPSATFGSDLHKTVIPPTISNVDFHDVKFMNMVHTSINNNVKENTNDKIQNTFQKGVQKGEQREIQKGVWSMLECLSFCHNVIVEEGDEPKFNASSPDELAFVNMAKYCGWVFSGINKDNEMCVSVGQGQLRYKLLHVMQFTSDRKRMSVIVQAEKRIFVLTKGADNVLFERLKAKEDPTYIRNKITAWSKKGLRTLIFAKREINRSQYEKWARMYAIALSRLDQCQKGDNQRMKVQIASNSKVKRTFTSDISLEKVTKMVIDAKEQQQLLLNEAPQTIMNKLLNDPLTEHQKNFIEKYFSKMEPQHDCSVDELQSMLQKELELVGATAIEDKLQDNVYESISLLRECGVKIWMLTGDKKETALDIGYSCGLITSDMGLVHWQTTVEQTLVNRNLFPEGRECCLVASGEDLLRDMNESTLLQLVSKCKAVVCCRVSPKQKQDMVWLMRKNKCTTLAVGDGANDVNMINTAHVGVGIKGVEGAQAALCSDYAISQFQILAELMLYHGRQCYRKNAQLIMFNFYKNMLLSLPQFWYGFYNSFSSATIYDQLTYQLYNVLFTSFPILIYAVHDQQHSRDYLMNNPQLYQAGITNTLFSLKVIIMNFVVIPIQALIICWVSVHSLGPHLLSKGQSFDLITVGMNMFAQVVIVANIKVLIISFSRSMALYLTFIGGILSYYFCGHLIQLLFPNGNLRHIISQQVLNVTALLTTVTSVCIIYVFEILLFHYTKFDKTVHQHAIKNQEIQLTGVQRK